MTRRGSSRASGLNCRDGNSNRLHTRFKEMHRRNGISDRSIDWARVRNITLYDNDYYLVDELALWDPGKADVRSDPNHIADSAGLAVLHLHPLQGSPS